VANYGFRPAPTRKPSDDADSFSGHGRGLNEGTDREAAPMAWLFAVMLIGLLAGCAQFEAQKGAGSSGYDGCKRRQ